PVQPNRFCSPAKIAAVSPQFFGKIVGTQTSLLFDKLLPCLGPYRNQFLHCRCSVEAEIKSRCALRKIPPFRWRSIRAHVSRSKEFVIPPKKIGELPYLCCFSFVYSKMIARFDRSLFAQQNERAI